jgi:hypothetical protein
MFDDHRYKKEDWGKGITPWQSFFFFTGFFILMFVLMEWGKIVAGLILSWFYIAIFAFITMIINDRK